MLDLEQKQLFEIQAILREQVPNARVWAYGSRVQGRAKRFSDLDLAIQAEAELDLGELFALKDAFSESNLPIKVDVLDLHSVSPEFLSVIQPQFVQVL